MLVLVLFHMFCLHIPNSRICYCSFLHCIDDDKEIYRLELRTVFVRVLFWNLFQSCEVPRWINIKIILEWVHKLSVTTTHRSFYCSHDRVSPLMMMKKTICYTQLRVCLALFAFCWWRHNRLCKALWAQAIVVQSNEKNFVTTDIDFILDRACKKYKRYIWFISR